MPVFKDTFKTPGTLLNKDSRIFYDNNSYLFNRFANFFFSFLKKIDGISVDIESNSAGLSLCTVVSNDITVAKELVAF